ncbi:MAG: cofactor-independent phosphoglycerate mutase [Coriobacteriia bacterium]
MKHVIVILDGAAGWPLPELDGRTTLEAARTPNLDALAAEGTLGLAQTVPEGAEPSSAAACTAILGYDPVANAVGRGAIEAASMGIALGPGQVALRLNLVSIVDGRMSSYACGHIPTLDSAAIMRDLSDALAGDVFSFHPGVSYRHILVVTGHRELFEARYTPPHDISDKPVSAYLPDGPGADLLLDLMERARPVLAASAVNNARARKGQVVASHIWPFWPGVAPERLIPFAATRGRHAALTSGVDLLNGLARLFGIDRLEIDGVTDGSDNDYAAQTAGALAALKDHDVVFVHVESPDEEGHAGNIGGKIAAIEDIDREVVGPLRDAMLSAEGGMRLLAMPDHPTPIAIKTHVGEAVPFVIAGSGVPANGGGGFDEHSAAATGLRVDPGHLVLDRMLADQID